MFVRLDLPADAGWSSLHSFDRPGPLHYALRVADMVMLCLCGLALVQLM